MSRHVKQIGVFAGFVVGTGVLLAVATPAHAQTSPGADALNPESDASDLFTPGGGNLNSPLDLYHRANLANSRSTAEFMQDQRSILSSEIQTLRQQQQELLQGQPPQPQVQPESPETAVPPTP